ncbi:hypothetical protein BXT89_14295 [Halopseudomonas pachastrellae]|uniref:Uncharacterized protein n=1 Tax=Halopseudomonas pachastrellae TaxID=254161 RepID=A0A1S8DF04_9GAMM|nr:hypothetical protein [Halopseudomonas pachastrellae]ONM43120.1 hypothetical protein BXT89_14295 [Halopseudomonas pachastrellae]SFL70808.1 hypothetical protein SAMN05216256_10179 [Halopseudomonas pachastrellae]
MAKSAKERKREQRAREKLKAEERRARLLAYSLKVDVYQGTADNIERIKQVTGIDEVQDLLTRAIHNISRLDDDALRAFLAEP